jgi:predicted glutamine amidotransferase
MCRLFGMHAGEPVAATFWLLDAPDSLAAQSHSNPDGAGIGVFDPNGAPIVDKQPLAAWDDPEFATAARTLLGSTSLAHVRYASTGALKTENTHPFLQDGRLCAHNGVVEGLPQLEARLVDLDADSLVVGDTDSERYFALITAEIRNHDGDVAAGIVAAVNWIADQIPFFCLNVIITTATEVFALRYPNTNELYVLPRAPGGHRGGEHLDAKSQLIRAHAPALAGISSVLLASEPMDDDPAWRPLGYGELLQIGPSLEITSSFPFEARPRYQMTLDDLNPTAAESQTAIQVDNSVKQSSAG